jgi:hypothetical protein
MPRPNNIQGLRLLFHRAQQRSRMRKRDRHIAMIAQHGRIGWQRRSGYNRRTLIETAIYRYKTIIGRRLCARSLLNQRTEAKIGCNELNRMARSGMPVTARTR